MKNKKYISKTIAIVLCVITITISTNIYLSYKDLYISNNNSPVNSIIYTALAKTTLTDSNISMKSSTALISTSKINKEDLQKKIFINTLILFLSFISLASMHNLILNLDENKEGVK